MRNRIISVFTFILRAVVVLIIIAAVGSLVLLAIPGGWILSFVVIGISPVIIAILTGITSLSSTIAIILCDETLPSKKRKEIIIPCTIISVLSPVCAAYGPIRNEPALWICIAFSLMSLVASVVAFNKINNMQIFFCASFIASIFLIIPPTYLIAKYNHIYQEEHIKNDIVYDFTSNAVEVQTLQDMTSQICKDIKDDTVFKLKDSRDNEPYAVAKLADGNCWMAQNLRLGNKDSQITLTSDDTEIQSTYVLPKASSFDDNSGVYYLESDEYHASEHKNVNYDHDDLGNLYNYSVVTAGSYDSENSICPKGWHLPTGGENGEWSRIASLYKDLISHPVYLIQSGHYYHDKGVSGQGLYGFYWAQGEASKKTEHKSFSFDDIDYINFNDASNNEDGLAVRCVLNK